MFPKDAGSGNEEPFVEFSEPAAVDQWTSDGRFVIFRNFRQAVYAIPPAGDRAPRMHVDMPFFEDEVHVAPDGRWVAFNADESGRWEVHIAAFPGPSGRFHAAVACSRNGAQTAESCSTWAPTARW